MDIKAKDTLAVPPLDWRSKPRRRFTPEQRRAMVLECGQPGASVAQVAHRNGINANLLFTWRKLHSQGQLAPSGKAAALLPVTVSKPDRPKAQSQPKRKYRRRSTGVRSAAVRSPGAIEIEVSGARIYLHGSISEANLQAVLRALAKR